ncbi:hypothetical protein HHK36_014461 [Tetracentron sinense]|uniref:BHLH domain-containing protein n=1 Tax=Tetracentron sinense TaxID=13715 RepID=A0A834Z817_TETSI|nr:hypothetical protein HHK36_014461 [Tetracentron sinense]
MDEFLDHLFSSSSWSDVNATEGSSWVCNDPAHTNELLPNSIGVHKGDGKNSPMSMISSGQSMESLTTQCSPSILVGGDSIYGHDKGLLSGEAQPQQEGPDCESEPSLNNVVNGNSKAGYLGLRLNTTISTPGTLNHSSPKLLPVVNGSATLPRSLPGSGPVGNNGSETSDFQQSIRDSRSLPSIPQLWLPTLYGGVSSLSPVMGQDKLPGLGLQGEYVDSDANVLGNRYPRDEKILQLDNLSASISINGQDELQNHPLSSFAAGNQITLTRTAGLQSQLQLSQLSEGNPIKHYTSQAPVSQLQYASANAGGVCNGAVKPRARARRGQATDPHSIAERLRREKIAERMKNLQELVPNSNKGSSGPLSLSAGQGADLSESPDIITFEQEVVKLMESNMSMAMQYLQNKGLCLMPIALAAAISSEKASSGPVSGERKKPGFANGLVPHNNGSPAIGTWQMPSNIEVVIENATGSHNGESITASSCNSGGVKQEQAKNTSCTAREVIPKA